ncbi:MULTISPECIES: SANT/Myb-like DNA-binding domain-containing protein [Acetobacter]
MRSHCGGIIMTEGRSNWTKEEIDLVVALRNQGHAWRAIGRHIGRSEVVCRYQYEHRVGVKGTAVSQSSDHKKKFSPSNPKASDIRAERGPNSEPLPIGHPVVLRGLWRGLEQWMVCSDNKEGG